MEQILLTISDQKEIKKQALQLFEKAKIALTDAEKTELKIIECGDRNFYEIGLLALTFINSEYYGGRFIIFLPNQFCPLHIHPHAPDGQGKVETFRVLFGQVIKYWATEEKDKIIIPISAPELRDLEYENHIVLNAGEQSVTKIGERHWYKSGPEGAIAMEISTPLKHEKYDIWTDKTSYPRAY
jgi:D-lyxose ketol-isomerase